MPKSIYLGRLLLLPLLFVEYSSAVKHCNDLLMGQYLCETAAIDPNTQQPYTCRPDHAILLTCKTRKGLTCYNGSEFTSTFEKKVDNACRYATDVSHSTSLILSVFFGVFGADRFYLGHFTMGMFKLFSCGFFFLLYMADVVFIALEMIGSQNEASYFVYQHGPRVFTPQFTNESTLLLFNCFDCVQ